MKASWRWVAVATCCFTLPVNAATTFVIRSIDGAGEGLNDPTPITPAGGNPATTLGEARMNVLREAGRIWSTLLVSDVPVTVDARFDDLNNCTANSGTLGSAGPLSGGYANFPGAPQPDVVYVPALADALSGQDISELSPATAGRADIRATFNSQLNGSPTCLGGTRFYYGYDHSGGAFTADLLAVALHEFAHGLGFVSSVNESTGNGFISNGVERFWSFDHALFDEQSNQVWPLLSAGQRLQSGISNGLLAWNGAEVRAHLGRLTAGKTANNRLRMYAPTTYDSGSSVSHWDRAAFPNLLMEPSASAGLGNRVDMTVCAFKDIGWKVTRCPDVTVNAAPVVPAQAVSVAEDFSGPITLQGTDADGDGMTFTVVTNPARGSITGIPSGTPTRVTYTPNTNVNGTDSFTVTANDGNATSAAGTVTITITPVNDAPTATATTAAVQSGQTVSIAGVGADIDGDTLTYSVITSPGNGTATAAGASISYRANAGFTGTDTFTYAANDASVASVPATISVTVTAPPAQKSGGGGGGVTSCWLLLLLASAAGARQIRRPG